MRQQARKLLAFARWRLWVPLARLIGRLRSPRQAVFRWPEDDMALGARVALFMHFDGRGDVRPQLLHYLRELKVNGRDVVFVTNAGRLKPDALAALKEICAGVIVRRNVGYDFGAWREAIDLLGLPRANTQEVILANDSVFGPLAPLSEALHRLNYARADVWGLTESWQLRYHLQSFFLAFGPRALRAPAWRAFWDQVRPVPCKPYIVKEYEVGITQAMVKGGLSCAAIWGYEPLVKMVTQAKLETLMKAEETGFADSDPVQLARKRHLLRLRSAAAQRIALNPTADLWRQLLLSGFPFLKRELLRDNPARVEDVGDWAEVVRETLGADPGPILQDLRLMLKGGAP